MVVIVLTKVAIESIDNLKQSCYRHAYQKDLGEPKNNDLSGNYLIFSVKKDHRLNISCIFKYHRLDISCIFKYHRLDISCIFKYHRLDISCIFKYHRLDISCIFKYHRLVMHLIESNPKFIAIFFQDKAFRSLTELMQINGGLSTYVSAGIY